MRHHYVTLPCALPLRNIPSVHLLQLQAEILHWPLKKQVMRDCVNLNIFKHFVTRKEILEKNILKKNVLKNVFKNMSKKNVLKCLATSWKTPWRKYLKKCLWIPWNILKERHKEKSLETRLEMFCNVLKNAFRKIL